MTAAHVLVLLLIIAGCGLLVAGVCVVLGAGAALMTGGVCLLGMAAVFSRGING